MFKQNVRLENTDRSHRQWISLGEAERRSGKDGDIYRVTARKVHPPIYRMKAVATPSNSRSSACTLTRADMELTVSLGQKMPFFESHPGVLLDEERLPLLKSIQRLMGLHALPLSEAIANL
jgi:hypothetical protein